MHFSLSVSLICIICYSLYELFLKKNGPDSQSPYRLQHGRRNIKTIEGAHNAECQSPGTKGGSLNLTDLNDKMSNQIIGGGGGMCPQCHHGSYAYMYSLQQSNAACLLASSSTYNCSLC